MKTTKKACNLVPCLYIVQYMICVCVGGPTSIFFQGAPNPLATALCVSVSVCVCVCVCSAASSRTRLKY